MEEITEQKGSAGEHTPRSGGIKAHKAAAERHEAEGQKRSCRDEATPCGKRKTEKEA